MTEPYAPNNQGLTEVLIDLKSNLASRTVYPTAGFVAVAFENVNQGEALYARVSDGKVGKAIANDTFDKANVIGIAQTTKPAGQLVGVVIVGVAPTTGLSPEQIS